MTELEQLKQEYIQTENEYAELKIRFAELKAKTQWHDLRKNPDDLPEESGCYLCILWSKLGGASFYDVCRYIFDYKEWGNSVDVIAWCELPEFKE